jgi:ADP-ribosylglycohydrolase
VIRLTWAQPEDLVGHELAASTAEGKHPDLVAAIRQQWVDAGGDPEGTARGATEVPRPMLRRLAGDLLDRLDAAPVDPDLDRREPLDWVDHLIRMSVPFPVPEASDLQDRLHGAWLGRAIGCVLGKPVEKIPRVGIREILASSGQWPLRSYVTAAGVPDDVLVRWPWNRRSRSTSLAENINGMPEDDDLNFAMLALAIVEQHGRHFSTDDVATAWLDQLPAGRVFTAERAAYRNLLLGIEPPATATTHNPFREWIGAAIRTDVYGWVHPGDPVAAARLAARDARLSHTRVGVDAAIFVAAMCAVAVVGVGIDQVLAAGLSVLPPGGRYRTAVELGIRLGASGEDQETCVDAIEAAYGDLHWVHALNNGALVAYALSSSRGDLPTAITTAVMGGWDTDSNGATVGSVCGALAGFGGVPRAWAEPLHNQVSTTLAGFDGVGFDELASRTVAVATA